ncbi:S9 family peptidase [Pirellulimonas nuda]|nr:S9 family peptidase [Pirellulimonas nuda]
MHCRPNPSSPLKTRLGMLAAELSMFLALLALAASGCATSVADAPQLSAKKAPAADKPHIVNKPMPASLEDAPLIPREVLFGNPTRAQARISPDGKWLSFLAPVKQPSGAEVMNVWVAPIDKFEEAVAVTEDKLRGIRGHSWSNDAKSILYSQDKGGDENWHLYATDVATKKTRDLTPIEGVNAQIAGDSQQFPGEILVGLNDRNPQLHDIYRVNLATGERKLVQENPGVAGFITDDKLNVRMALNFTETGGQVWMLPKGEAGETGFPDWDVIETFGPEDAMTSGPAGYTADGKTFYFQDSRNRDTAGLFATSTETGETKLIAEDKRADAGGALVHPVTQKIQAVSFTYARREWRVLDPTVQADLDYLGKFQDGEFEVTSRTTDDTTWSVAYILDDGPVKYYRYTRPAKGGPGERSMTYLFSSRDDLDQYPLVKMHDRVIESRDGMNLVCYLTLPPGSDPDGDGVPNAPVPMVLDVHGGPWARDGWGFNGEHQWLANRGYAVLNVNYRGSTGFGKEFINAANGQWSGQMHDDLLDAVDWAVKQGIAQRDKVCIMGGSYGGYATLVGLTYTPQEFACGVDIVGPSSLVTLLQNAPPYWAPFMPVMKLRVGDWTTDLGKEELLKRSPLTRVDKIERPLLIGQGANDPRVTQVEADQIVEAMQAKNIPVTYVLYPDEGHGFARPENRMSFNAVTEAFLAEHLGGRYEPIGEDFEGASITVPTGANEVPGLEAGLKAAGD